MRPHQAFYQVRRLADLDEVCLRIDKVIDNVLSTQLEFQFGSGLPILLIDSMVHFSFQFVLYPVESWRPYKPCKQVRKAGGLGIVASVARRK